MTPRTRKLFACLLVLSLTACGGSNSSSEIGSFRLANGIADSGTVTATVGSAATVGPISYGSASGLTSIAANSYTTQLTTSALPSMPFTLSNLSIGQNEVTTVFTYGTLLAGTQNGLTAQESLAAPASGNIVMQGVDAAYTLSQLGLGAIAFDFFPPGAGTATGGQSTGANFGSVPASQAVTFAAGKYEIQVLASAVCNAGQSCPAFVETVFDSGPNGLSFPTADGSTIFQIAAIDNGANTIALLLLGNNGFVAKLLPGQN